MAKTKGTVGRKPDDPPIRGPIIDYEPPTRRPKSTPMGRGKSKPRPEMEWYEGDQRPVKASDRIYYSKKGKNVETFNTVVENIDKVHGVKASQNPIQLSTQYAPGSGALGVHYGLATVELEPGPDQGKVREYSHIVLNSGYNDKNEPAKRGTSYHEIGHSHDRQQNFEEKVIPNNMAGDNRYNRHYDSENAFAKVAQQGTLEPRPGDTPTVQWAKSVQRSQSYKSLVEKRERARKDGSNPRLVSYLEYLTDPKELYARSYAQFITRNADPEADRHMRDSYKKTDPEFKKYVGYDQWRGKDFDSINDSFNRIYGSRGLDIHNMKRDPRVPIEV